MRAMITLLLISLYLIITNSPVELVIGTPVSGVWR